jgi:hypothetical protein
MSLVLSLSGLMVCWLPTWGWIGIAVALVGCIWSFRGFADPRTTPGDLGYNIAGYVLGGWGLTWGLALQIKHAVGSIDFLLLPFDWKPLLYTALAAFGVFWISVFVSRRLARTPMLVIAGIALAVIVAAGSSTFVLADRELAPAVAATDAGRP